MPRSISPILTLAVAVMAAIGFGAIAHDDLGITGAIRTGALAGIALIGSALAAQSMRKRNK